MKKIISSILCIIFFVLSFHAVHGDTSLNFQKGIVSESGTLSEGVSYESFAGTTYTDAGTSGSQNISVVTSESTSPTMIVSWSVLTDNDISGANVIDIAENYEQLHPGFEVLASINGDYFNMSNFAPINALVQDGSTVKYTNFYLERYFSVGFTNDEQLFIKNKSNELEDTFSLTITDDSGVTVRELYLEGLNRIPTDGGTTAYYGILNAPVINDAFLMEANIDVKTNYDSLMLQATCTQSVDSVSTETDVVTVATKNSEVQAFLQSGYHIRIQKNIAGVNQDLQSVIGVGSQPLEDSVIKEFEDINDQNISFAQTRHPRSSFGFTDTGDFYLVAFDGRQTDMVGVNLREMSYVMQQLGCVDAFNLDGGGSTQIAIKEDGNFRMLNSPSDVPYRRVTNAVLIVRPDIFVEGSVSNIVTDGFDFEYTIDNNGLTILDSQVYVNGEVMTSTGNSVSFTDLNTPDIYNISIQVEYQKAGINYTRVFYKERLVYEEDDDPVVVEKQLPNSFELTITKDNDINGFSVSITFLDPDDLFVKMYLIYDEQKILCKKAVSGYTVDVPNAEHNYSYALKIEFYYTNDRFVTVSDITDETTFFTYISDQIIITTTTTATTTTTTEDSIVEEPVEPNNIAVIIASSVGAVLVVGIPIAFWLFRKKVL